jgi:hypothetical protein
MTTPNVPRAGDAPAVVWVIYGDGSIWGAYDERVRAESSFRSPLHEPHTLALYARVPDAATLDARIATFERFLRHMAHADGAAGQEEREAWSASAAEAIRETVAALASDLRAARDASGRDAHG